MSNWTDAEVDELMDAHGGGNTACQHIWLAKAPAFGGRYSGGTRPREGDRVEVFKKFVMDAYEYGQFKADAGYTPAPAAPRAACSAAAEYVPHHPAPAPAAAPVAAATRHDLVSFDDPFSSTPFAPPPVPVSVHATPMSLSQPAFGGSGGFDEFGRSQCNSPMGSSRSTSPKGPPAGGAVDAFGFPITASTSSKSSRTASVSPQPVKEVDLLSYEEVGSATPSGSQKASQSAAGLLDLLSMDAALPAAPMRAVPAPSSLPPAPMPMAAAADPFGFGLLTPSPSTSGGSSPNPMGCYPPAPMSRPMGAVMGGGPMAGMGVPRPMGGGMAQPSPMMPNHAMGMRYGSPMAPMGGGSAAISSLGASPSPAYRSYGAPPPPQAADKFSFLQETMKKHLDNPN